MININFAESEPLMLALQAEKFKLIRCVAGHYNLITDGKLTVVSISQAHKIIGHPQTRKVSRNVWERRKPKARILSFNYS